MSCFNVKNIYSSLEELLIIQAILKRKAKRKTL